jgi:hypothetical protein
VIPKRYNKYFPKSKVYVVSLVCLKSEKYELPGNFQVHVSRIPPILSSESFEK